MGSRSNNPPFSLQFNNTNTGLFTVNTGMKNISQVHMVDSWNGLKEVSSGTEEWGMPGGRQGELGALGAAVCGSALKTSFYRT